MKNKLSWMIGGPQGSGVDSSANTFARTCAMGGLWIYGKREYHSNIKGEHSYFQIRVDERPVHSHLDDVHMLATFEAETVRLHKHEVIPGGALLYDPAVTKPEEVGREDILLVPVPYGDIIRDVAREFGKEDELGKLQIMKNVISVAASLGMLRYDFAYLEQALLSIFTGRRAKLAPMNIYAGRKSYDYALEHYAHKFPYRLEPVRGDGNGSRIILTGTTATALGKLVAGCRFQTYYPITPASDESEYLEGHPEYGIVVVQTEDEIAALTMAIGAGLAGARAATSTSGPGFSLMAESMGWSGMNEVPVVIFNYQRGGPSTGLPTRHEQGDLKFALSAGHGEFPRIVLAAGDLEDCFYASIDAFNWAERYQLPVVVLLDKALANSTQVIPSYEIDGVRIDRGQVLTEQELLEMAAKNGPYRRFAFTESGISPRSLLGHQAGIFWNTGDEHDEFGHITEDGENRIRMLDKRMRKLETAAQEIPLDKKVKVYGPERADLTIVSWGSTRGAILDAMDKLEKEGYSVNFLQIRLIKPFPSEFVAEFLARARRKAAIEMNYSGQLAAVIREETGIAMDHYVLKWNGRPISENEVVASVEKIMKEKPRKVVLTYGV